MAGILVLVLFIIAGIFTGLNVEIPYSYSQYIAVAILACLDSVFGAFAANIEKKFRMNIFLSGFFGNAIIAMILVYIGIKLNVDIYLAAVIVFGGRLLNNFSTIRRDVILNIDKELKKEKQIKKETQVKETKQEINKIENKEKVEIKQKQNINGNINKNKNKKKSNRK